MLFNFFVRVGISKAILDFPSLKLHNSQLNFILIEKLETYTIRRVVILFHNVEHCGINSALGIDSINSRNSEIGWNRNRWEFLGIPSDSGIAISNIILLWLLHLLMIKFQSGIPEFRAIPESVRIPYNSAQFCLDTIPGIPARNWIVFRWNNLQAYHNAWDWEQTCDSD
jgi:hypothetical protein